ncbi:MAG: ABC transporter permease subunit [Chloroflexi bacterium]|nr:ABC transporter permease subunit [Chloroflexota bacterium]
MPRNTFYRFMAPSMIVMTLLMVVPILMAIWLGMNFMTYNNINAPQFVGLRNYVDILQDPQFWQSFRFTFLYALFVVPATIITGFTIALLLDQVGRIPRGIYMSLFLLPFIIVPIVGTLMFKQLFEPSGLFTYIYQTILDTKFRYNEISVKILIILYGIWYVAPFAFVVYFAGLQTLSQDQIEAASIDGASRWQKIRYIVIPHLRSLTILILLFSIMDTYRVFDSVFVLSEMNPIYKADTIMTYTFKTAVTVQRLGKANAMAILTVLGIMVVLIPNLIQAYREQMEER